MDGGVEKILGALLGATFNEPLVTYFLGVIAFDGKSGKEGNELLCSNE